MKLKKIKFDLIKGIIIITAATYHHNHHHMKIP